MDNEKRNASELVYVVLDETLPVIHTALVSYYGFSDSEAEAFKDTLAIWFQRVGRRANGRLPSSSDLREQLAFVACKYARALQLTKANSGLPIETGFAESLQTPPEEVAFALLNRLEFAGSPS